VVEGEGLGDEIRLYPPPGIFEREGGLDLVLFGPGEIQVLGGDVGRLGHHDGPADLVRQLPNIAGPGIGLDRLDRLLRKPQDLLPHLLAHPLQEELGHEEDVFAPLPERRDVDHDHAEPVVEVLPEPAVRNRLFEVHVRRGDDAGIDLDLLPPPDPLERLVLEESEELDLEREREFPDLVQEERPPLGVLYLPFLLLDGTGKGPPLVAEQLGLEEGLGDRPAVDGDEGARLSETPLVDGLRREFLPGATFADDQDRDVGGGHLADGLEDPPDPLTRPDHLLLLGLGPCGEGPPLVLQLGDPAGPPHDESEEVEVHGLAEEVVCPVAHGPDGVLPVPVAGADNDLAGAALLPEVLQPPEPPFGVVRVWRQAQIQEDKGGMFRAGDGVRGCCVPGGQQAELILQCPLELRAGHVVIFNEEDLGPSHTSPPFGSREDLYPSLRFGKDNGHPGALSISPVRHLDAAPVGLDDDFRVIQPEPQTAGFGRPERPEQGSLEVVLRNAGPRILNDQADLPLAGAALANHRDVPPRLDGLVGVEQQVKEHPLHLRDIHLDVENPFQPPDFGCLDLGAPTRPGQQVQSGIDQFPQGSRLPVQGDPGWDPGQFFDQVLHLAGHVLQGPHRVLPEGRIVEVPSEIPDGEGKGIAEVSEIMGHQRGHVPKSGHLLLLPELLQQPALHLALPPDIAEEEDRRGLGARLARLAYRDRDLSPFARLGPHEAVIPPEGPRVHSPCLRNRRELLPSDQLVESHPLKLLCRPSGDLCHFIVGPTDGIHRFSDQESLREPRENSEIFHIGQRIMTHRTPFCPYLARFGPRPFLS